MINKNKCGDIEVVSKLTIKETPESQTAHESTAPSVLTVVTAA